MGRTISLTREDLPEPLTPVTAVMSPTGMRASMPFRLFWRQSLTENHLPSGCFLTAGTSIFRLPARKSPVKDRGSAMMSSCEPQATISPPCTPAPGPTSTI